MRESQRLTTGPVMFNPKNTRIAGLAPDARGSPRFSGNRGGLLLHAGYRLRHDCVVHRGFEIVDWIDPGTPSHSCDFFSQTKPDPCVASMKGLSVTRMTVRGKSQMTLTLSYDRP